MNLAEKIMLRIFESLWRRGKPTMGGVYTLPPRAGLPSQKMTTTPYRNREYNPGATDRTRSLISKNREVITIGATVLLNSTFLGSVMKLANGVCIRILKK